VSEPRTNYDFALNPEAELSVRRIGREGEPVVVVDRALRDAGSLVDCAAEESRFAPPPAGENFYPGILAPAPLDYVGAVVRAMDPLLREVFALQGVGLARATCNFSLVTLAPEALNTAQRLPHVDTDDALQFAFLHYLCDERFGGTAFYRHRSTGFETLRPERASAYGAALARELGDHPPEAAYIAGDTPLFEETAAFDARFDRLLVYRSRVLHSGRIRPDAPLSADPRKGRLTANIFVNYAAA